MKCPKCKKSNLRKKVNLFLDIPADCYKLSKQNIRKSTIKIEGAGWPTELIYCTNPNCGWIKQRNY